MTLWLYSHKDETVFKHNLKLKLFHFQPRSVMMGNPRINLSFTSIPRNRKGTLHNFIHIINRLLPEPALKYGLLRNLRCYHPQRCASKLLIWATAFNATWARLAFQFSSFCVMLSHFRRGPWTPKRFYPSPPLAVFFHGQKADSLSFGPCVNQASNRSYPLWIFLPLSAGTLLLQST